MELTRVSRYLQMDRPMPWTRFYLYPYQKGSAEVWNQATDWCKDLDSQGRFVVEGSSIFIENTGDAILFLLANNSFVRLR